MGEYMDLLTADAPPAAAKTEVKPPAGWYNELAGPDAKFDAPRVKSDSEHGAAISDIAVASLANDTKAQIRYLAKQRGIPEDRYKVINDRIAYQAKDGNFYYEVPEASLKDPKTIAQGLAAGVGPSIPAVPSAAVGVLTAPMMVTGPAGAAASTLATAGTASSMQAAREGLAHSIMGQEVSPLRIAGEGISAATGQAIGAGLTKFGERGLVRDINQLDTRAAADVGAKAQAEGVALTPAEKTGLPSLAGQQKALGNLPQASDKMAAFYKGRDKQVRSAVQRFLDRVSPIDSAEVAGETAAKTAKSAMRAVEKERADQASPFYKKAFAENPEVDVNSVISSIDDQLATAKGGIKTALERAKSFLYEGEKPDTRLDALHQAKLAIDDMISNTADSSIGKTARRKLVEVKNELLDAMDKASPSYAEGRAIFADLSPNTQRVSEGLVGRVADLGEQTYKNAARTFFGPSSGPRAIEEAKALMVKQDPAAWQGVKRAHLQDLFEKAQTETMQGTSNTAGKFRQMVMGNMQQRERLKAALDPTEWKALSDLTLVLERASSVKQLGSDTAWNQEMMKVIRDDARPWYSRIVRNLNPAQALKSFDEWATERNLAKNADKMADIITNPDAMKMLKEIKRLPPASIRARVLTGHLLVFGGRELADEAVGSR